MKTIDQNQQIDFTIRFSGGTGIAILTYFPLALDLQQTMPFVAIGWPSLTLLVAGFAVFFIGTEYYW